MKLRKKFSIYVPSTVDVDKPIDNSAYVEKTARFLSEHFGGCTRFDAVGNWIASDEKLVAEKVTICYAFCDVATYYKNILAVKRYARALCAEMRQEAISVEYCGKLTFEDAKKTGKL